MLLIEQGHADEVSVASLLQEGLEAFIKRHDKSPIDLRNIVELLVSSPDRDDQLVRDVAERVKPWAGLSNTPPMDDLSVKDLPEFDDKPDSSALVESAKPTFEIISEVKSVLPVVSDLLQMDGNNAPASGLVRNHRYDSQRFGSQDSLLSVLQNNSGEPIADLLESFKL